MTHTASKKIWLPFLLALGLLASFYHLTTLWAQDDIVRYVRPDGADVGNCTLAQSPCATISYALNQSSSGDKLFINGAFLESVQLQTAVDIVGMSVSGNPAIWSACTPLTVCATLQQGSAQIGIDINLEDSTQLVTLQNLELNGSDQASAIWLRQGTLHLNQCKFTNNKAIEGGALKIGMNGRSTIEDCRFEKNQASLDGGAIYLQDGGKLEIVKADFVSNESGRSGGAIFLNNATDFTVKNSDFISNSAESGGAISASVLHTFTRPFIIENSIFLENLTSQSGGAISIQVQQAAKNIDNNVAEITGSTFQNNAIVNPIFFESAKGGAIFIESGHALIRSSNFSGNQSPVGGAIFYEDGRLILVESKFDLNSSSGDGGAIFSNYAHLAITNTDFTQNQAEKGGAIYINNQLDSEPITIKETEFLSNTAAAEGGAISTQLETDSFGVEIDQSTFSHNQAGESTRNDSANGGAIVHRGGDLMVSRSDFIGNVTLTAAGLDANGGALYLNGKDAIISKTTLKENNESAIYLDGMTLYLTQSAVYLNTRSGIGVASGQLHLINSTVVSNVVSGIWGTAQGEVTILSSTIGDILIDESAKLFLQDSIWFGEAEPASATNVTTNGNNIGPSWGNIIADPLLGPLQDNGGPTWTRLPAEDSPALDRGGDRCLQPPVAGIDQRGEMRPIDSFCDLGAVEGPNRSISATETPVPATETPIPVTETPILPTETPIPVTETPILLTETPGPTNQTYEIYLPFIARD